MNPSVAPLAMVRLPLLVKLPLMFKLVLTLDVPVEELVTPLETFSMGVADRLPLAATLKTELLVNAPLANKLTVPPIGASMETVPLLMMALSICAEPFVSTVAPEEMVTPLPVNTEPDAKMTVPLEILVAPV